MDKTAFFIRTLREKGEVLDDIKKETGLDGIILNSALTILFFSAIYGVAMGLFTGGFVILMDMVKVPLILLLVLYTSSPVYYVIAALAGLNVRFKQILALLSSSYAVAATVLLSFTPVVFVYSLSESSNSVIHFMHYALFSLAGVSGVYYLFTGMWSIYGREERGKMNWLLPLMVGGLLTLLVGVKLVWLLKPYFHYNSYFFEGLGLML